jgi:hypothetical protein
VGESAIKYITRTADSDALPLTLCHITTAGILRAHTSALLTSSLLASSVLASALSYYVEGCMQGCVRD